MITEETLRARRRGYKLDIKNLSYKLVGASIPRTTLLTAKIREIHVAIERIDKGLELFEEAKKPQYPPIRLGTDPTALTIPGKGKTKQRKHKKKTVKKDKVAFALGQ